MPKAQTVVVVGAETLLGRELRDVLAAATEGTYDTSNLIVFASGGAILSASTKAEIKRLLPNAMVVDGVGSSETGAQMSHLSTSGAVSTGTFNAGPDTFVAAEDLGSLAAWLRQL